MSNFTPESLDACKARLKVVWDMYKAGELTKHAAVEQIQLATEMLVPMVEDSK